MKNIILFLLSAFCTITITAQTPDTSVHYGDNVKAAHTADIRGIKMYYEIYGEGKPLLIIHGNSGSIGDFQFQIPHFAKKYKVIVADSRDHGKTLDTLHMTDSLSYEMMSDDYAALLDYLKIDSCFVLGWSDGGINGLLLAMRHPEKVKKLAITGANLWPDSTAVEPFILKMFSMQYNMMKLQKETTVLKVMKRHYKLLLTQPHISTKELMQIACPTLVIGGDHDVIKPEHTLLIAQSIPKSNVWIVPNAGHGVLVFENKDKFNAEVDAFFNRDYKKIAGYELFKH
jgi:pimeloyl-ACP methyl ester carboxylesterase